LQILVTFPLPRLVTYLTPCTLVTWPPHHIVSMIHTLMPLLNASLGSSLLNAPISRLALELQHLRLQISPLRLPFLLLWDYCCIFGICALALPSLITFCSDFTALTSSSPRSMVLRLSPILLPQMILRLSPILLSRLMTFLRCQLFRDFKFATTFLRCHAFPIVAPS
jgi:hypothetical protein